MAYLPAVVQGVAIAAPVALKAAGKVFDKVFAKPTPVVIDVVEKTTGIKGAPQKALRAIKENPITAALVAWEIGSLADTAIDAATKADLKSALKDLIDSTPDVAEMVTRYGWKFDEVEVSDIVKSMSQSDELLAISQASALMRGKENLLTLRRALMLPDSSYIYHDTQLAQKANVF